MKSESIRKQISSFNKFVLITPFCLVALIAGCITTPENSQQVARYAPNIDDVNMSSTNTSERKPDGNIVSSRPLRPGDPIIIHLRGIQVPEIIEDVVDSRGSVNLPLIGSVRVEGMTTSEAEIDIEKTYKEKEIYKQINVIVVAQQAEFFIQGEVKQVQGRYPLTADLTLLRAIATAGGPTPFAHPRNVDIIRNGEILSFDREKIREGKSVDPLIEPDDIIIVRKRRI